MFNNSRSHSSQSSSRDCTPDPNHDYTATQKELILLCMPSKSGNELAQLRSHLAASVDDHSHVVTHLKRRLDDLENQSNNPRKRGRRARNHRTNDDDIPSERCVRQTGRKFVLICGLWLRLDDDDAESFLKAALDDDYDPELRFNSDDDIRQGQLRELLDILPNDLETFRSREWFANAMSGASDDDEDRDGDGDDNQGGYEAATTNAKTQTSSRDDFYTPEQSPQPTTKADLGSATVLRSPADTDSTTPCPLRCDGCGIEAEEGDDDPNEVQCEKCRLWSHTACLDKDVDWDDPDVRFVCTICETNHEDPLGLFKVGEIVMLPNPFAKDEWRPTAYAGIPLGLRATTHAVQEPEDDFSTYLLVPTTYKTREFCQEISAIQLEPSQVGKVILPSYANPYPLSAHENPQLSSLFALAITPLAKILAEFNTKNAVIDSYTQFFGRASIS
ncbi:hypothetical protein C8J57DRAFT_1719109 [Mycena rebaudengoi]|nr:hypothetical protein C8J57DRAFT_1719109 [Mycena rebaudengoi]